PHWPSVFYVLFIPIGAYHLLKDQSTGKKKLLYSSIGFSLVLTLFLYAEIQAKWFTFPDYKSPFRDIYGFEEIAVQANGILTEDKNPRKALAVTNWTMGSRMIYYALPYGMKVFVIDERSDQFDFWEKELPKHYDLLFVNTHFHQEDIEKRYVCDSSEKVKSLDILLNGGKVDSIDFIWCRNYRGPKP
ncbi:MAG: hypothetical protein PHN75_10930, partial [Syntrophales bacterium]|nr:hypothetical protein [Syntrophales bacterium]